ncbi:MAG: hypothetical protein ACOCVF_02280 [bacterium]
MNAIKLNGREKILLVKLSRLAFTDLDNFVINDNDYVIAFGKYEEGINKVIPRLKIHWLELTLFVLPKLLCDKEHKIISTKLFNDYINDNVHPVNNLFDIYFDKGCK